MENIYAKVNHALDEKILECPVSKIKRNSDVKLSVSYMLHPSIPIEYIGDKPTHMEHEVQIDIWGDYNLSIHNTIVKVIELMRINGFGLVSVRADMYEPATNMIHKPLIFKYIERL